jgi:hypothetical protein
LIMDGVSTKVKWQFGKAKASSLPKAQSVFSQYWSIGHLRFSWEKVMLGPRVGVTTANKTLKNDTPGRTSFHSTSPFQLV